ncbi:MAG TPA: EAL domain-containing protein [Candidatus Acidoferrales bacterium]|nr:EAL domain-containing protein [Candidatus Acidoferrales bacterium]
MRILVADDDPTARRLLKAVLERAGYEVLAAENGRAAAEQLSRPDGPRLALLDWMMPELDGPGVCREVRSSREQPHVHIILVTAKDSRENIVAGLEAGADDYLTKPFSSEELLARLKRGQRIMQLEDKLVHNALHDSLTELPNRALFLDRLAHCIRRAERHPEYKFAVLFVDLDRFKIVNDSLGHLAGDKLLVDIARRLTRSIRRNDLVSRPRDAGATVRGGEDTLARLGGDEFTILLEDIQDASDGIRVAERIQQQLASPLSINSQEIFATASIGIALSDTAYKAAEDMVRDADIAVHRAKAQGGSRCEIFDRAMHVSAVGRLKLETDLRRAIEHNQFRLHYQPIVSLGDRHIIGFEALLRWQRPGNGLVPPGEFLPVAEETGLIVSIGRWAIREACRQMKEWNRLLSSAPPLTMAVNISAKQFAQPNLVSEIMQVLRDTGLDPGCLKLELTESLTMRDAEHTAAIVDELRALGVRLSIDDFGTGYSSLSYLRRFAIDTLKIDRSFVSGMSGNVECFEIVKTIMTLAHNLGMAVVAEGTETAEQVRQLESLACEYAQGYFFSRPVDSESVEQMLLHPMQSVG